jgi:hypothetical protein
VSAPYTAVDGARITVDRDAHGLSVNCSVCGDVASDPDDEQYVEEIASHHEGWHEAEYQRAQSYR